MTEIRDIQANYNATLIQASNLSENIKLFVQLGIQFSTITTTETGLRKSILDATFPVRAHFKECLVHDYYFQKKGPVHKAILKSKILTEQREIETKISLYRPETKNGDPRLWVYGLQQFAKSNDTIALIADGNEIIVINLSNTKIEITSNNPISDFLLQINKNLNSNAINLLSQLKEIAKKPLLATKKGDTAIGMAIENALGIKPNSSKDPDYFGIEIKSSRGKQNRTTLFAQVPEWDISNLKSSKEILERYGYYRDGVQKLYCTISSKKQNPQGLSFFIDEEKDLLHEIHCNDGIIATWTGEKLRYRLNEKHNETFWINAKSMKDGDNEIFILESATHTMRPITSQLIPLLDTGKITMDHLIKGLGEKNKKVSEKGPLFKIGKENLDLLFPTPRTYTLKKGGS